MKNPFGEGFSCSELGLAGTAKKFHFFHGDLPYQVARGPEYFARVENVVMFRCDFSHAGGKGDTKVCINVDFPNAELDGLLNEIIRDSACCAQPKPGFESERLQPSRYARGAVQDERKSDELMDFFQARKIKSGIGCVFIRAVGSADGHGQRVAVGFFDKNFRLFRAREHCVFLPYGHQILDALDGAKFGLNGNIFRMSPLDDAPGGFDIFFK